MFALVFLIFSLAIGESHNFFALNFLKYKRQVMKSECLREKMKVKNNRYSLLSIYKGLVPELKTLSVLFHTIITKTLGSSIIVSIS